MNPFDTDLYHYVIGTIIIFISEVMVQKETVFNYWCECLWIYSKDPR